MFAFASSVYPEEWQGIYIDTFAMDLFEFAFHARRINQILAFDDFVFPSITKHLVVLSEGDPGNWEDNYQFALNRLAHARKFVFGNAHADHRKTFTESAANLTPIYVKIETDKVKNGMKPIALYGLLDCFLSVVLEKVRADYPAIKF